MKFNEDEVHQRYILYEKPGVIFSMDLYVQRLIRKYLKRFCDATDSIADSLDSVDINETKIQAAFKSNAVP